MIELSEQNRICQEEKSSKGNQLKWEINQIWYKADYTGYEGLAEYVVSGLLQHTNLKKEEYICYETEKIGYKQAEFLGCKSINFLPKGWQLVTLERLFHSFYGESLYQSIYRIADYRGRIEFLVEQTIRLTGLKEFGPYISKLLTIDALVLNEDRHTHNIAVLMDSNGIYHYCPMFDHGAALLSDTTLDYPIPEKNIEKYIGTVKAKTICASFDEQLDVVEGCYGQHLRCCFGRKELQDILDQETNYPKEKKERIQKILSHQQRKYSTLFEKKE